MTINGITTQTPLFGKLNQQQTEAADTMLMVVRSAPQDGLSKADRIDIRNAVENRDPAGTVTEWQDQFPPLVQLSRLRTLLDELKASNIVSLTKEQWDRFAAVAEQTIENGHQALSNHILALVNDGILYDATAYVPNGDE